MFMNKLPFLWNIYLSMRLLSYMSCLFFALLDRYHPFFSQYSSYSYILALSKNSHCSTFSQYLLILYNFFKLLDVWWYLIVWIINSTYLIPNKSEHMFIFIRHWKLLCCCHEVTFYILYQDIYFSFIIYWLVCFVYSG